MVGVGGCNPDGTTSHLNKRCARTVSFDHSLVGEKGGGLQMTLFTGIVQIIFSNEDRR